MVQVHKEKGGLAVQRFLILLLVPSGSELQWAFHTCQLPDPKDNKT